MEELFSNKVFMSGDDLNLTPGRPWNFAGKGLYWGMFGKNS
jgi:hypothetical protein